MANRQIYNLRKLFSGSRNRWPILLPLLLLWSGVTYICLRVVWLGDDLDYMFRMQGAIWQSWGWIRTPGEFWSSQWQHYLNVNGRFVAHTLVQLFNGVLGQTAFAIVNGGVYCITVLLLARLGGRAPLSLMKVLSAVFLLLFGFVTKMMPTCQIGYVWGLAINLLWIGLFFSGREKRRGFNFILCLTGLVAGNWNEAYSVGIGGALGVMLLSNWLKHPLKRLDRHSETAALFYIAGTASVCLAPSTLARAASFSGGVPSLAMITLPGWVYALLSMRIFYIFAGILIYKTLTRKIRLKSFLYAQSFWIITMALLIIFNLLLGVFGNRQLFGIEMCSTVLAMRLLKHHSFPPFITCVALAGVFSLYAFQFSLAMKVRAQYEAIEQLFRESENGHVYFDRRRASVEGFTREAKIYEDIVGLYDNDPHHSLLKYFRLTDPMHRKLLIIPETVKKTGWTDTVCSFAQGHYIAIGEAGDTIVLRSVYSGAGIKTSFATDRLYDFHKSIHGPHNKRLIVITPSDPWLVPERPGEEP